MLLCFSSPLGVDPRDTAPSHLNIRTRCFIPHIQEKAIVFWRSSRQAISPPLTRCGGQNCGKPRASGSYGYFRLPYRKATGTSGYRIGIYRTSSRLKFSPFKSSGGNELRVSSNRVRVITRNVARNYALKNTRIILSNY